jgi:hypothetical protein
MKKFLLTGCLILINACQSVTSTPAPESTPTTAPQTPTMTATVTSTFTSTPSPSPTPIPLFFTEDFDFDLGAWISFQTSGDLTPPATLQNGLLVISFASPHTWYYAIHNAHDYFKIHIDTKFDSTDAGTASMGLVCMYSEAKGWYEYNISSDGTYNILLGQWVAQGIAQYRPIVHNNSEYLTPGRTAYEIGLTCEKDFLWLYINGKLFRKLDVSRFGLEGGKVGIAAAVFENVPVTAYFESFEVSEPPE